ncbi:EamA family transporter [Sneathiella sp. P13V-1]|uniref:DMT family transporter n=1 Tax=Sneathiella sp. P13V-1 TaxID=2697366 RepID=UPI00187B8494|nr:DMT family transporter [Sneathiella sp. P13V-1]MBE7635423.1 EamA family transporter [Sneathiella sp. P13V-1]
MSSPIGVQSNNLHGILFISAAIFMLSSMDAVAKWLVEADYSVFQILFIRACINFVILSTLMPFMGGIDLIKTKRFAAHGIRGFFGFWAPALFFSALQSMPIAEATVIFFISPFVMTAISVPLFKEQVGIHRWGAIIVGFCGVLYVMQPTSSIFNPAAFLVLGSSLCYSFLMLASRWLGQTDKTFTIVFYVTFWTAIFTGVIVPFVWKPIPLEHVAVVGLMALLSLAGNFFIVRAFTIGEVGVITPFEYSGLLWAVLFGMFFFDEIPGQHVWIGVGVILLSGLYMVYRENKKRPAPKGEPEDQNVSAP